MFCHEFGGVCGSDDGGSEGIENGDDPQLTAKCPFYVLLARNLSIFASVSICADGRAKQQRKVSTSFRLRPAVKTSNYTTVALLPLCHFNAAVFQEDCISGGKSLCHPNPIRLESATSHCVKLLRSSSPLFPRQPQLESRPSSG
ncbi:hypothetical protein PoB_005469500 [Plakobranchus ocellatus]|uniref:Uncharacterized protein n=1 Tax=Plakobranchus ocellatus TaxID=259542 RepID=A0AAV4C937_9GAST|nr:hypothetical protein PoB_005469500 [Plakobranchus ocellatus]